MATLETIKQQIESSVYQNNTQAITGQSLQNTLTTMAEGLYNPPTPSGDPLHYAYEAVGAVYNSSTGYWKLNGLTDITNDQMRAIFCAGHAPIKQQMFASNGVLANIRTNLPKIGSDTEEIALYSFAKNNSNIEVINLMGIPVPEDFDPWSYNLAHIKTSSTSWFYNCENLRSVWGVIQCDSNDDGYSVGYLSFYNCPKLKDIYIKSFGYYEGEYSEIYFYSDDISVDSIEYLINELVSDCSIEIWLTETAYDRIDASEKIDDAVKVMEEDYGCSIIISSMI